MRCRLRIVFRRCCLDRGCDRLVAVIETAELDLLGLLLALADNEDVDILACGGFGDDTLQILRFLDVLAVEFQNDVADLKAGRFRRTFLVDPAELFPGSGRRRCNIVPEVP